MSSDEPKTSWFGRLTRGLSKTSTALTQGITSIFTKRKLTSETLEDLEDLLIRADIGVEDAGEITQVLKTGRFEKDISTDEVRQVLSDEITRRLKPAEKSLVIDRTKKPFVILVVGVNGSGKTTTVGKLARRLADQKHKVVMVAGDTFRAAEIGRAHV